MNILDKGIEFDVEELKNGGVLLWSVGFTKDGKNTPMIVPWKVIGSQRGSLGSEELILRNRNYGDDEYCRTTDVGEHYYFKTLREVCDDLLQLEKKWDELIEPPKQHIYTWPCFIEYDVHIPFVQRFEFLEAPFPKFDRDSRRGESTIELAEKLLLANILNMELTGKKIPEPPTLDKFDSRITVDTTVISVDLTDIHNIWEAIWTQ